MLKILVADGTKEMCTAISETFAQRYAVSTCHDGKQALSLISSLKPDILWLDLNLPGMDGIAILQAASLAGIYPKVIAVVRHVTDYILASLCRYDVSFIVTKPYAIPAALMRIEDVAQSLILQSREKLSDPVEMVYNALLMHSACGKRTGHACLQTAVLLMMQDPDIMITKHLYPAVAAQCGGTKDRVERAIRTAITAAWINRDVEIWNLLFADYTAHCPSNGVFISRLAQSLRKVALKNQMPMQNTVGMEKEA